MATTQKTKVFERIVKNLKQKSTVSLKEVKCDGTPEGVNKVIADLTDKRVRHFEVRDESKGLIRQYIRSLSGNNYQIKQVKIKS